jgi:hypothetical protein
MPVSTACSQMCEPAVPVSPDRQFRERKPATETFSRVSPGGALRGTPLAEGLRITLLSPLMNGSPPSCPSHEESSPRPGSHPASVPWTDLASPPANHLGPRASPRPPPIAKPPANHLSPRASPRPPPIAKPPANHLGSRESPRLPRIASAAPIATAAANRHGCRQSPRLPPIATAAAHRLGSVNGRHTVESTRAKTCRRRPDQWMSSPTEQIFARRIADRVRCEALASEEKAHRRWRWNFYPFCSIWQRRDSLLRAGPPAGNDSARRAEAVVRDSRA